MKQSHWPLSLAATMAFVFVAVSISGLWRGLQPIRQFPKDTTKAMQPLHEAVYRHQAAADSWPESLDDLTGQTNDILAHHEPRYKVVSKTIAILTVHGPGHQFMRFSFFTNEEDRQDWWQLVEESGGGRHPCLSKPW